MNRRAFLGGTSAGAVLWAMGCHQPPPAAPVSITSKDEIRAWLRDAVTRLAAIYPAGVHALATQRRRTTAAVDVLGEGVSRGRAEGVVLVVRDADGNWREQVTSDLSKLGIEAAATALAGKAPRATKTVEFGEPQIAAAEPPSDPDVALVASAHKMVTDDPEMSSRIVYTAGVIDIDDTHVWSVAPGRDQEQRLVRVRRAVTRVAWSGTRPIVAEAVRGWRGGLADQQLPRAEVSRASRDALAIMTPGSVDGGAHAIALEPSVVALIVDTATRALLTSDAARRPEVARRLAIGAAVASSALGLVDDPTAAGAYGGFRFDDEGTVAAPVALLDGGRVVGRLADRGGGRGLRPGHLGRVAPAPTHLRLAPGTGTVEDVLAEGYRLEGGIAATLDPSSDRISVSVARALEIKSHHPTGRVYADIELVGDLGGLLAAVNAVAADAQTFPIRDDVDGRPAFRSIEVPGLATVGVVRARRRLP